MGAWGVLAFDNDDANDWAFGLDDAKDFSLVESAFDEVERDGYLEQSTACEALVACEVLARLSGRPGYTNAYTVKVDAWAAGHRIDPPTELIGRGNRAIDRVLGADSELREVWQEAGEQEWLPAVADLRGRLKG